jgi:hypothetical protein
LIADVRQASRRRWLRFWRSAAATTTTIALCWRYEPYDSLFVVVVVVVVVVVDFLFVGR